MLARNAESLYWIGRYVERADDTARILDVKYYHLLPSTEMVGSVNLKLGRPLSIVEGGASAPPTLQYAMFEAAPMAKSAGGSASPNLPGGAIEVRRSVTVTYELQQP